MFFIVIIIFFYNSSSIVEGLTGNISEYDYLAPVNPSTENISDEIWRRFLSIMAKAFGRDNVLPNDVPSDVLSDYKIQFGEIVTKAEIEYYINNGKFPYNGYVMKYLKNNLEKVREPNYNFSEEIERLQKFLPNREIYRQQIFLPVEKNQKPLPISAKIYLGQEKPPTHSKARPRNHSDKKNDAYKYLVEVCKKIK